MYGKERCPRSSHTTPFQGIVHVSKRHEKYSILPLESQLGHDIGARHWGSENEYPAKQSGHSVRCRPYFTRVIDRIGNIVPISSAFSTLFSKSMPQTIATKFPVSSINGAPLHPWKFTSLSKPSMFLTSKYR